MRTYIYMDRRSPMVGIAITCESRALSLIAFRAVYGHTDITFISDDESEPIDEINARRSGGYIRLFSNILEFSAN